MRTVGPKKPLPQHFKKGQSGNPSGRPKAHSEIIKVARLHSLEALDTMVAIMRNRKHPKLALKASELIMDRAWGRVPHAITGEAGEGPVKIQVSWQATDMATIDITPNEDVPLLESEASEDDNE
jgi:hypothetical protein